MVVTTVAADGRAPRTFPLAPRAAVVYAVVASLEKQYGILYAEWRAAEYPERTFAWTAYAEAPEVVGRQFGESIVGIVRKPLIEEDLGRIVRDLIARRPGRMELAG